jgi:signal transduction histidine kinase
LVVLVAVGALAGTIYVVFDTLSEARIREGVLTGGLASAHEVIDHVLPILVGVLLGVCVHYIRLRARLVAAQDAASRADALRTRLQGIERDQAVWVLAAAVLHELNNPLHAIGLLLDEVSASPGESSAADLIERARAQADRALAHLRALREVRGTREPQFQEVALEQVVGALADDVAELAAEEGLVVRLRSERHVLASADPTYLRTILENLLDNSMSSLRDRGGGCITIHLAAEEGQAVVRVSDDGPPVDPAIRPTLFEPLRTTKAHGLGLGLPIARALARAMRGDLSLESTQGKAFRLELPLRGVS